MFEKVQYVPPLDFAVLHRDSREIPTGNLFDFDRMALHRARAVRRIVMDKVAES